MESPIEEKGIIKSVQKSMLLLKAILNSSGELGISELQQISGYNQSTIHHSLKTLKLEGFISQNRETKKYTIGPELFNIWVKQNKLDTYFYRAYPVLEEMVAQVGETTSLFIRREHEAICIIGKESPQTLKASLRIGRRIPLHCTATGKAFLAYMEEEKVNEIIYRTGLGKYMPNTITSPEVLFKKLREIKSLGFAIELEEFEDMINAIGAPVFNDYGEVIFVVTVIAPLTRLTREKILSINPLLQEKARKIADIFTRTEF